MINNLKPDASKTEVFAIITNFLKEKNFRIEKQDTTRPWGGFFVIDESQAADFAKLFFPNVEMNDIQITNTLSPKILIVEPNMRLSWQYHFRRSEIWKVIGGKVGVKTSLTDEEGELQELVSGAFIKMDKGERHRLVGLDSWGIVAEIWQHTDAENPSDEEDIVRLQDDFGR
ncbi:cupin domain-containing protein [Frigoriflavimonas asaccharolytica]|uniref:Mannose-6-phosphate isomerase-like protein (Cupin superfamily) n=1 Tax=Frigoriflavimonas asaccharolytica TaxID=2735899 RepID=A0A8J8K9Q3_9FLAO|nr:phosphoheptose isomerase [Frigoriflavimonas asaccharolytica]NRS94038.1 mannose-6-phosphate isomerase-like protein (cupin superfamily) [Frigoriflavimonas asaccharolytica]